MYRSHVFLNLLHGFLDLHLDFLTLLDQLLYLVVAPQV